MKKNITEILYKKILKSDNIDDFLDNNKTKITDSKFCNVLYSIIDEKDISISKALDHSMINKSYGYQIFNGRRVPSRDKVLQLALGLKLSLKETNKLLKLAEKNPLYVRNKRDAIVIFAINRELTLLDTEEILLEKDCTSFF